MATMGSDNDKPFGQCRCCLKNGFQKDITYFRNCVREVYRDMFLECFNLLLSTSTELTNLICASCTSRLNDALQFKTMVEESEQLLLSKISSNDVEFINVAHYDGGAQEEEDRIANIAKEEDDDSKCGFNILDGEEEVEREDTAKTNKPDLPERNLPISVTNPVTIEVEKLHQTPPTTSTPVDVEDNDLFKLLQNNFEASYLLRFRGKSLENETARNLLASTISKHILKKNKNSPITVSVYNKWMKSIKALFPEERVTTYYIPPRVTAQGINHQARGKLVNQLINTRRKYQKLGVLDYKERKPNRSEDLPASSVNTRQSSSSAEEDLTWLKRKSEPWKLVEVKWKRTLSERSRDLRNPEYSIEQYFDDYPALHKTQGCKLLIDDFNNSYPDHINNFYLNFPTVKNKLIGLLSRKATKNDIYCNDVINLAKDTNEENRNLAAVLSLPELISPSIVFLPGQSTSSSTSDAPPAKRKKGKDNRWKPTKAESREAFVSHVEDESHLKHVINKRHEKITEKGFTPQPYIVMIGANIFTIKSYLVVVNRNIFYHCPGILAAVDSCFKMTWALNIEYAPSSYASWLFLQKGLYKLSRSFDKGSISVESLMTDCNLIN